MSSYSDDKIDSYRPRIRVKTSGASKFIDDNEPMSGFDMSDIGSPGANFRKVDFNEMVNSRGIPNQVLKRAPSFQINFKNMEDEA